MNLILEIELRVSYFGLHITFDARKIGSWKKNAPTIEMHEMCAVNCSCNDEIQLIMTAERSIAILHMFRLRPLIRKLCILWWWYVVMKISEQTKKNNWNWKDVDGISRNITRYTSSKWMELRGSRFVSDAIIYVCAHLNWMRGAKLFAI